SLLLPFLLSSILLLVYAKNSKKYNIFEKNISLTVLSGIFFGLAIFTKISVFVLIPLYLFLVLKSNHNNWKFIVIWVIPAILIPMIWPSYALARGEFNYWLDGIYYQTHRQMIGINFIELAKQNTLTSAIYWNYIKMPILVGLGLAGLVYAAIRKDYFL